MREIKFRAWDKKESGWLTMIDQHLNPLTGKIMCDEDNSCSDPECCGGPSQYWLDQEQYELMQFTGLFDKNGKEIYEGDIVACIKMIDYEIFADPVNLEVTFENGHFNPMCLKKMMQYRMLPLYYSVEIIGNIHEHNELLK